MQKVISNVSNIFRKIKKEVFKIINVVCIIFKLKLFSHMFVYMLAIAGQTAGPNGLNFLGNLFFIKIWFLKFFRATPGTSAIITNTFN